MKIEVLLVGFIIAAGAAALLTVWFRLNRMSQVTKPMEALMEQSTDGLLRLDGNYRILAANPEASRLLGNLERHERKDFRKAFPHLAGRHSDSNTAGEGNWPSDYETVYHAADGKRVPIHVKIVHAGDSGTYGAVAILKNLAVQKAQHRKHRINEEKYKSLFEYHPDAVFMLSNTGVFVEANAKAVSLAGLSEKEVLNSHFGRFVAPEDLDRVKRHFYQSLEGISQHFRLTLLRANGERISAEVSNVPVIVDNGIVGVYGICREQPMASAQRGVLMRMDGVRRIRS